MNRHTTTNIPLKQAYCEILEKILTIFTYKEYEVLKELLSKDFGFENYTSGGNSIEDCPLGTPIKKVYDMGDDESLVTYKVHIIGVDIYGTSMRLKYYSKDHLEVSYDKESDLSMLYDVMEYLNSILFVALEHIQKSELAITKHRNKFKTW